MHTICEMLPGVLMPPDNHVLLGQMCVCVCVFIHVCLQTSSLSRLNVTEHVRYQNILWHARKVEHGKKKSRLLRSFINIYIYILSIFLSTNLVVIQSGNKYP